MYVCMSICKHTKNKFEIKRKEVQSKETTTRKKKKRKKNKSIMSSHGVFRSLQRHGWPEWKKQPASGLAVKTQKDSKEKKKKMTYQETKMSKIHELKPQMGMCSERFQGFTDGFTSTTEVAPIQNRKSTCHKPRHSKAEPPLHPSDQSQF